MTMHVVLTRSFRGWSLIELMVVLAVVALLSTMAVATYRSQMLRANRSDGTATLLRIQVAQEQFFVQQQRYADSAELLIAPPAGLGFSATSPDGHYTLALVRPTLLTYTITASATSGQAADIAACRVLSINEQGIRTPATSSGCWH